MLELLILLGRAVLNCAHPLTVEATVSDKRADGVLFAIVGNDGGFSFYVQNGKLTYGWAAATCR